MNQNGTLKKGSVSFSNKMKNTISSNFRIIVYCILTLLGVMLVCVCFGSVTVTISDIFRSFFAVLSGSALPDGIHANIILNIRFPRVINVALCGAALSLSGAAMQGLLRNPLADGSTLGISSGASLGAVLSIAYGVKIPFTEISGTVPMAILFAFLSLIFILFVTWSLDHSLSTNSIILVGVVFSMFISSLLTLILSFSGDKLRPITFWTMGSLSGTSYSHSLLLGTALLICSIFLLLHATELNALSIGEENAQHLGINVKYTKLTTMIAVSVLIGVCVSVSGTIGFVGLVTPHITRLLVGPNHKKLLCASMFSGAVFLMLCDLAARIVLRPIELSVGVVTSLIGSVAFLVIFRRTGRQKRA